MEPLRKMFEWFDGAPQQRTGARVFSCAIAVAMLIRAFTELPHSAWLFGPGGIGDGVALPAYGPLATLLDASFASNAGVVALFCVQIAAAIAILVGVSTRVATAVLLFCVLAFEGRHGEITDGGDNLSRLSLMYLVFLLPAGASAVAGSVRAWLHNLAVVLVIGQVLTVYLIAGIMKARGDMWMNGTALYMVSQIEWISLPALRGMFKESLIAVPAAYVTVLWQVSFPVAVFSRLKLPFVAVGLMFHLGIGFFMGLTTFSLVMIGAEAFLITDSEYAMLRAKTGAILDALRSRIPGPVLRLGRSAR